MYNHYAAFGNGYVPFFAVIGPGYQLYYGDNGASVTPYVNQAVNDFNHLHQINSIDDQIIGYNESLSFDISNLFIDPNGNEISFTVQSNNADIASAELDGNNLTVTAGNTSGSTSVIINATAGEDNASCDFNVTVYDPNSNIVTLYMHDSYGDGWGYNGNFNYITFEGQQYSCGQGESENQALFELEEGTYTYTYTAADGYGNENTWEFVAADGEVLSEGQGGSNGTTEYTFTVGNGGGDDLIAPETLTADITNDYENNVLLTWTMPGEGNGGDEFEGESFEESVPPAGWDAVVTNVAQSWMQEGIVSYPSGDVVPVDGEFQAKLGWDYGHQDEWLISDNYTLGNGMFLNFWTYCHYGSTHADHYYVKISTDNGSTWTELWDASALPEGDNMYDSPVNIDLNAYAGETVKFAWQAVDGPTNDGLWYVWFIDAVSISDEERVINIDTADLVSYSKTISEKPYSRAGDVKVVAVKTRDLTGFKVYRNGEMISVVSNPEARTYTDSEIPVQNETYTYYVTALYGDQESAPSPEVEIFVMDNDDVFTGSTAYLGSYPNPFNPSTSVKFSIGKATDVSLVIYNVKGQVVRTLQNGMMEAGPHSVQWNGTDDHNKSVASGVYYVRLNTSNYSKTDKILLMK
ncbi:MAG: hypothetical protein CSB55_06965 [Candidatus Cloacimonadota bacterium]|nr:MAG: hypothetical protein CSB55_06965 [Candidatus Cloacimonadota bacterium]